MTVMKSEDETTGRVTKKILVNANVTTEDPSRQLGIIKANQVTAWISSLQPDENDTILIYYNGHGMINEEGIHILNFDPNLTNDFVTRGGLRDQLKRKQCRLKMLITDTCSNQGLGSNTSPQSYGRVVPRKRRYTEELFLKHSGFLDITAASPGEKAWGNSEIGGFFTAALIESFTTSSDTDKDGSLSWEEVLPATRDKTQEIANKATFIGNNNGRITQTPKEYSLPEPIGLSRVIVVTEPSRDENVILFGHEFSREEIETFIYIGIIIVVGIVSINLIFKKLKRTKELHRRQDDLRKQRNKKRNMNRQRELQHLQQQQQDQNISPNAVLQLLNLKEAGLREKLQDQNISQQKRKHLNGQLKKNLT